MSADGTPLARAARGDDCGFAELVAEHGSMVYSIALHFLRDASLAEDMAQEVFLLLHRNLRDIESPAHLIHWLRRTAAHRCIDQARRMRLRPRIALDQIAEPSRPAVAPDTLLTARLQRLIAALPERSRALIVLRYGEDMEPSEISELLGLPLGTVKSTLHRALGLLRTRLERPRTKAAAQNRGVVQ